MRNLNNKLEVLEEREVLGQEFKIYGDKENPLFLAKDVATWIEHSKPRNMVLNVDEDEKVKMPFKMATSRSTQEQWFLTEDGLYEVLMQSRKPIAKAFKKEVKKILKEIRLTGSYSKQFTTEDIMMYQLEEQKKMKQQINEVNHRTLKVESEIDNLPLLTADSDELTTVAKRKVVALLGGKGTPAYKQFNRKAFSDLYHELHRQFDVNKICAIKRKDLHIAKQIISNYELPIKLRNDIELANNQVRIETI